MGQVGRGFVFRGWDLGSIGMTPGACVEARSEAHLTLGAWQSLQVTIILRASFCKVSAVVAAIGEHRRLVVPPRDAYGPQSFEAWGSRAASWKSGLLVSLSVVCTALARLTAEVYLQTALWR